MMYSLTELEALPDLMRLTVRDSLKVDRSTYRVWLSRCTVEDGEPFNNKVTIERLVNGSWVEVEEYQAV